jgi:hypothetical protein
MESKILGNVTLSWKACTHPLSVYFLPVIKITSKVFLHFISEFFRLWWQESGNWIEVSVCSPLSLRLPQPPYCRQHKASFGHEVKQNIMVMGVCGWGCSPYGGQEAEREEKKSKSVGEDIAPKNTHLVTCFRQLDPTSESFHYLPIMSSDFTHIYGVIHWWSQSLVIHSPLMTGFIN